jgi:hypothetical protein
MTRSINSPRIFSALVLALAATASIAQTGMTPELEHGARSDAGAMQHGIGGMSRMRGGMSHRGEAMGGSRNPETGSGMQSGGMGSGMRHGGMSGGMGGRIQHGGMSGGMSGGMKHGGMSGGMGTGMQHGGMAAGMGMMGAGMQNDAASAADMRVVHQLIASHDQIKRTVTNLPNGIKTVTESDNPQVAQAIKEHVASMGKRLKDGRQFSMFSPTLPVLFQNRDKIHTEVTTTNNGAVVIQASSDAAVVTALQSHAVEVSTLSREGMAAMHRSAMAAMQRSS